MSDYKPSTCVTTSQGETGHCQHLGVLPCDLPQLQSHFAPLPRGDHCPDTDNNYFLAFLAICIYILKQCLS